jgi:hypothetical protein
LKPHCNRIVTGCSRKSAPSFFSHTEFLRDVLPVALAGNLYPIPEGPYGKLPLIYLAYLALGMIWFFAGTRPERETAAGS